jgi:hypothetical protein
VISVTICRKGNAEILLDVNMTQMRDVFRLMIALAAILDMDMTMTNALVYPEECAEVRQDASGSQVRTGVYHQTKMSTKAE